MGALKTGPSYIPEAWTHHEGHPGWRFDQIEANLDQSLATSTSKPDLVTIHLGTNDCGQMNVSTIQKNAEKLLTHLFTAAPKANVFMASMIGFPSEPVCSAAFDALVPPMAAAYKAKGMKITYVPMAETSGVCKDKSKDTPLFPASGLCCGGQVHPTAEGYLRMASVFGLSMATGGFVI
jgi:lysophospholipase L1-like esterase